MKRTADTSHGSSFAIAAPPRFAAFMILSWSAAVAIYFFHQAAITYGRNYIAASFARWISAPWLVIPSATVLISHLKHIAALFGFSLIFFSTGHRIFRVFALTTDNPWEEIGLSYSLGYGLWGTVLLFMGLAGLWSKSVLLILLFIAFFLAVVEARSYYLRFRESKMRFFPRLTVFDLYCISGFVIIWLFILGYAIIPETFFDALEYHLGLPNLFLLAGRIIPTPENSFSGSPALPSMLYAWTLALDSWGITASLLHWSVTFWLAAAIIGCCRRLGHSSAGYLAATAFSLSPVVIGESYRVAVHIEWALMEVCCFIAATHSLSHPPGTAARRNWLMVTGGFLGFAMCTKYPAWLLPIALTPMLFVKKSGPAGPDEAIPLLDRFSPREFIFLLCVAALLLAPWIAKNTAFYHNPLYPFFHHFFAPAAEFMPDWRKVKTVGVINPEDFHNPLTFIILPIRFLTPSQGITMSLGIFALAFFPFSFWNRKPTHRLLAWFCLAAWIPLMFLSSETRFYIPHLAMLTILTACSLFEVTPKEFQNKISIWACALCLCSGFGWWLISYFPPKWETFRGSINRSQYLSHNSESYPAPAFTGIEYVNATTPPGSRVILYGDPRGFYLQRPYLASSSDQLPLLDVWAEHSSTVEELKQRINREQIRYVIINFGELANLKASPETSLRALKLLDAYWNKYALRIFGVREAGDRWVGVYRILNDSEASAPHPTDNIFNFFILNKVSGSH